MSVQVQTSLTAFVPAAALGALDAKMRAALSLQVAKTLRARWVGMAQQRLTTNLQTYRDGIQQEQLRGQAAVVSLLGAEPNRLEHGSPAYDMRSTLLGPNVPVVTRGTGRKGKQQSKSGGFYRSIPFRHQTPGKGSGPEAMRVGKPMGYAYAKGLGAEVAKDMGKAIYAAARKLSPTLSEPHFLAGQKTVTTGKGASKKRVAVQEMQRPSYGGRLAAGVGGVTKLRPHHATDIYAGMVRLQKTYQKATQNSYMTFRTISTRKTVGWMHPGTPGYKFMEELAKEFPDMASAVVGNFLRAAGGSP